MKADGAQPTAKADRKLNDLRAEVRNRTAGQFDAEHVHNHTVSLRVGAFAATGAVVGDRAPVHEVLRGAFDVRYVGGRTFSFSKAGTPALSFHVRIVAIDYTTGYGVNSDERPVIAAEQSHTAEVVGQ